MRYCCALSSSATLFQHRHRAPSGLSGEADHAELSHPLIRFADHPRRSASGFGRFFNRQGLWRPAPLEPECVGANRRHQDRHAAIVFEIRDVLERRGANRLRRVRGSRSRIASVQEANPK